MSVSRFWDRRDACPTPFLGQVVRRRTPPTGTSPLIIVARDRSVRQISGMFVRAGGNIDCLGVHCRAPGRQAQLRTFGLKPNYKPLG
ncbi:MAG: hypothetical protein KME26_10080 [Oscillatoria princeps RMCB-10]|nr:hypothetical protein [Oscillatoria princeps RMCB-10]